MVKAILESGLSLRKALFYTGCSRKLYYRREHKQRDLPMNQAIVEKIQAIAVQRPTYGTRRMAAMLERTLNRPVNRKQVQRIYRKLAWIKPSMTKNEIIARATHKVAKASEPFQIWEADFTYINCSVDGWGYLFNVFDVFTREWAAYVFDLSAVKENAIISIENALIVHNEIDPDKLTIRVDNGSQYRSKAFRHSMQALKLKLEYIARNTPEQNAFIESFHKTLKKEYIWCFDFQNYQEAEEAIKKAFLDYNQYRIHSALGYLTPYEFLRKWLMVKKMKKAERVINLEG